MSSPKPIKFEKSSRRKTHNPAVSGVGAFFREKRMQCGLSPDQVAEYLGGISLETLAAYETGKRVIPLSHIYALSNCLNISPQVILSLIQKPHKDRSG